MKKLLVVFVIVLGFSMNAQILEQGNSMINIGLGMGSYNGGDGYETKVPPVYGSYEYMINDQISVGAFVGYYATGYDWSMPDYNTGRVETISWDFTYLNLAGVANYHFVNNDAFDAYGGLKLGYTNVSSDISGTDIDPAAAAFLSFDSSGFLFGAQIGARYFFTESMAVNLELGYGVALLQGGITFKF